MNSIRQIEELKEEIENLRDQRNIAGMQFSEQEKRISDKDEKLKTLLDISKKLEDENTNLKITNEKLKKDNDDYRHTFTRSVVFAGSNLVRIHKIADYLIEYGNLILKDREGKK